MARESPTQTFSATLEPGDRALGWTIARVPFTPADVWPNLVRLRVQGTINGHPFRTSLFPATGDRPGGGGFYLLVNRAMQQAAAVHSGSAARFTLQPDLDPRPAELPDDLAVLLDEEPGLRPWYDTLTEYTRREIGKWVLAVKSPEAQLRRAGQMAERLFSTMDAERELPPLIATALRRNAKAAAGWQRLSLTHRRTHLLAIFYYRTPESQAKRLQKMIDECAARA